MSPDLALELERIRRLADPPAALVRLCAWSGCGLPLVRRPGEEPAQFAERQCCNADCGHKRCGEVMRGGTYRFGARRRA